MTKTSVKIKFRPSTDPNREGSIYYQIIHNRIVRQVTSDYKIFKREWNVNRNMIAKIKKSYGYYHRLEKLLPLCINQLFKQKTIQNDFSSK